MRRGVVVVAVAVALAACSDDGGSTTSSTPAGGGAGAGSTATSEAAAVDVGYDTCAQVPVEMVNRNLGLDLPEGALADPADPRTCEYGTYSFDGAGNVHVTIHVAADSGEASAIVADRFAVFGGPTIEGLGDEAFSAESSSQITVRRGNVVVDIYAEGGQARLGSDDPELQALAQEILGIAATLPGAVTTPEAAP